MPNRTTAIAATVFLLFALTGCGGTVDAATPSSPVASAPAEVVETVAPLTAVEAPTFTDLDAQYLFEIRKRSDVATIANATDQQLVDAGHAACEALAINPDIEALRLIDGEVPRDDGRHFESAVIGTHATMVLCPEYAIN